MSAAFGLGLAFAQGFLARPVDGRIGRSAAGVGAPAGTGVCPHFPGVGGFGGGLVSHP